MPPVLESALIMQVEVLKYQPYLLSRGDEGKAPKQMVPVLLPGR